MNINVSLMPVADLTPYERNARKHDAKAVARLVKIIERVGWTQPVLFDGDGDLIAGHKRRMAALAIYEKGGVIRLPGGAELPPGTVPAIDVSGWSDEERRAYILADNQTTLESDWDGEVLRLELSWLQDAGADMELTGFDGDALAKALGFGREKKSDPDTVPPVPSVPVSEAGDVWLLGGSRIVCGDSTDPEVVAMLVEGEEAYLLHADPPYGMGKQSDGVENDNLYREKLDEFQMAWWGAFRPHLAKNASAYIWGNAPDLWRLWYSGGLGSSERLTLRNEIVWDKKSIAGMASPDLTQFPIASERCLFFQLGDQFLGNINSEDFPEAWEPIRAYLKGEADKAGMKAGDVKRVCGCGMYGHWFTKSQFTLIPKAHYEALADAYPGSFERSYLDLSAEWAEVRGRGRDVINGKLAGMRSYFDNAHDIMRDVWEFPRVTGDERHGHATPKPVAMMERVMRSSLPVGGICLEPFSGSGSTVIAAEATGRRCFTAELKPEYVDVTVKRWQGFTGKSAIHAETGETFEEVQAARA